MSYISLARETFKKISTFSFIFFLTFSTSAKAETSDILGLNPFGKISKAYQTVTNQPSVKRILSDDSRQISLYKTVENHNLETTQFQDYYQGLEVLGSRVLHHSGPNGTTVTNAIELFDVNTQPGVSMDDVILLAQSYSNGRKLKKLPELKILPHKDSHSAQLIYWVNLGGKELDASLDLIIDAHTGELVAEIPHLLSLAHVEVYSAKNAPAESVDPLTGAPLWIQKKDLEHVVKKSRLTSKADTSAIRAANNAKKTLEYYQHNHGRNSYDAKGAELASIVHIGKKFANAFWNNDLKLMAYGDGDGEELGDFTLAVDVAGHEMTHAVISETANLLYYGESGALNEAFADFFGKMIENNESWVIGKDLFLKQDAKDLGIRDMKDPHNLSFKYKNSKGEKIKSKYPKHMDERLIARGPCQRSKNDNCWVHINSTIPSHAAYLVAQAIGKQKAQKIYYTVLTQYLTPLSGLRNAFDAGIDACKQLFDGQTCSTVEDIYLSVGM